MDTALPGEYALSSQISQKQTSKKRLLEKSRSVTLQRRRQVRLRHREKLATAHSAIEVRRERERWANGLDFARLLACACVGGRAAAGFALSQCRARGGDSSLVGQPTQPWRGHVAEHVTRSDLCSVCVCARSLLPAVFLKWRRRGRQGEERH